MGGGARFRVGIALSAIGEGLREAARDFGGASLRCVCLPLSPAGSGHPPHRFITPSKPGEAEHLALGVMGLYQAVAIEEGYFASVQDGLLLLIAHPRHEPQGHSPSLQLLGRRYR